MRSNLSAAVLLILVIVCFTLGLVSALARHPAQEGGASTGSPTLPPTAATVQSTVLVLGVDSLEAGEPTLLAAWLASFRLPGQDIFLLGVPIDAPSGPDGLPLAAIFQWSSARGPEPSFLTALYQIAPLAPDVIICLDREGFAALVDYLGGLDLNGVRINGAQVIAVLDLLAGDPAASLASQGRLLEAMALRAPLVGATPDLTALVRLIPDHAYLSTSLTEAAAMVAPLLPVEPGSVHLDYLTSPSEGTATASAP